MEVILKYCDNLIMRQIIMYLEMTRIQNLSNRRCHRCNNAIVNKSAFIPAKTLQDWNGLIKNDN